MPEFYVIKANGEKELFDYKKLEYSLKKLGATEEVIKNIILEVGGQLHDGITTREIYQEAFSILKRKQKSVAVRYSLRKAVGMLGPTGFPFEQFVSEILRSQGYETVTNKIVTGRCAEHEVDIVAWKENELVMLEAKFHAHMEMKSDLKVALYVKARFDDLIGLEFDFGGKKRKVTDGWLITNTKFSHTAISYSECQRLHLIGWNYPYSNTLHNMIEKSELIPITALTTITTSEKNMLLAKGYVISKKLTEVGLLEKLGFNEKKAKVIREEILSACANCVL
jgi:hypothetical protein